MNNQRDQKTHSQPAAPAFTPQRREYLAETYGWTASQVDVIRNAICVTATDEELEFFLATCKRLALDPFARQIWFVKRKQKVTDDWGNEEWKLVGKPETSIDGFRTIAERTGEYAGQDPIMWCGSDGKWVDVWLKSTPPLAAKAAVYRKGIEHPFVSVAVFDEFAPTFKRDGVLTLMPMWAKMPSGQLAKCAESLSFRRGFPRDLSGIQTDAETQHEITEAATFSAPAPAAKELPAAKPSVIDTVSKPAVETREPVPAKQAKPPANEQTVRDPKEPTDRYSAVVAAGTAPAPTVEVSKTMREQATNAGVPVETPGISDPGEPDPNDIAYVQDEITTSTTLDHLRALAKEIESRWGQESAVGKITRGAYVAKWNTIAAAERKAARPKR